MDKEEFINELRDKLSSERFKEYFDESVLNLTFLKLLTEKEQLQKRIDKAIEYINQLLSDEYGVSIYVSEYACEYEPEWKNKLLEILKGSDNNE